MNQELLNQLTTCPVCGNPATKFNISRINLDFLQQRLRDQTLDPAIGLSCTAWANFPALRLNSDSQVVINSLITSIERQVTKVLLPLEIAAKMTAPLQNRLDIMVEKLPGDFKKEFSQISEQIDERLKTIEKLAENSNQPIEQQLKELFQFINLLTHKPIVKGSIGEEAIALAWPEVFPKDRVCKKGGPGQTDIIVFPHIAEDFESPEKITIERKAGSQRFSGNHLHEATEHCRQEGGRFCVIIYDSQNNLLDSQKPLSVLTLSGITVGICDMETSGWRTLRQLFGIMLSLVPANATPALPDLIELKKTIDEMHSINLQIDLLRKNNNSAISNCEKVHDSICELEKVLVHFENRLRELLIPLAKPISKTISTVVRKDANGKTVNCVGSKKQEELWS